MGFANLSIAEIAADYDTAVTEVFQICDRLGIPYKNPQTRLALEDAKAIISEIMAQSQDSGTNHQEDLFSDNQNTNS
ncbi:translation initiation factor IF-2 [Floridanema evergladense]|uniref:Translation initiation factor IF-2 n=1 Tax=Floridaenema evergladense BLCC-F167 TaxID=3153639 RepID=A0ABV4WQ66_9CYAN